ncbi:hypothetical protein BV308_29620 [Klebsiella pneumoniae]|nr:hypothetical protein BV308_29620 [Klebsiella pneumoniae]
MGGEFLPKINEGDLLYMPSTLPGVSPAEAAALLQTTDMPEEQCANDSNNDKLFKKLVTEVINRPVD